MRQNVTVELTRNKHAYAQRKEGGIVLRIPKTLSPSEQDRVIDLLLSKIHARKTRQTISLFAPIYTHSTAVFWNRETVVFGVVRKRKHYGLIQGAAVGSMPLADAIAGGVLTKTEAKSLLLEFCKATQSQSVEQVVREYAHELGVHHRLSGVYVNQAKTKWGSAHADGSIRISLKTLLLPEHLFRYVCAHEASHLIHMNHGTGFWNTLERLCPDAKHLRKELHTYGY